MSQYTDDEAPEGEDSAEEMSHTDDEASDGEDSAEEASQKPPGSPRRSNKKPTICEMVKDEGMFGEVREPGPLQLRHLGPDTELFLFTIPSTTRVQRMIGAEVVVGGERQHEVTVGKQHITLESFPSPTLGTTLFLPDQAGQLHPAGVELVGQVVVRDQCRYLARTPPISLDKLRSVIHQPPTDLRDRNFFVGPGPKSGAKKKKKKKKENKEKKEVEVSPAMTPVTSLTSHMTSDSPGKVKTKKRKRKHEVDDERTTEEMDLTDVILSPVKKKKKIR